MQWCISWCIWCIFITYCCRRLFVYLLHTTVSSCLYIYYILQSQAVCIFITYCSRRMFVYLLHTTVSNCLYIYYILQSQAVCIFITYYSRRMFVCYSYFYAYLQLQFHSLTLQSAMCHLSWKLQLNVSTLNCKHHFSARWKCVGSGPDNRTFVSPVISVISPGLVAQKGTFWGVKRGKNFV